MGRFTGFVVNAMRSTGKGSDYFGRCECCRQHASETWGAQSALVYQREDGRLYMGGSVRAMYGHEQCLRERFPSSVLADELERCASLRLLPESWSTNISAHCIPFDPTHSHAELSRLAKQLAAT